MRQRRKTAKQYRLEARRNTLEIEKLRLEEIRNKAKKAKKVHTSGVIYKATNLLLEYNNMYIGKTYDLEKRKKQHIRDANRGSQFKFHKALMTYGINNFKWEIVDRFKSIEECNIKERDWISRYNAVEFGYNEI